jgi:DNA-binding protein YbaB
MLDSFKAMGMVANLMKNKDAIAQGLKDVQARLESRTITVEGAKQSDGSAGIKLLISGKMQVQQVIIAPALLASAQSPEGKARLEQLLAGAMNAAVKRVKEVAAEEIGAEAKKLGLGDMPGIEKLADL